MTSHEITRALGRERRAFAAGCALLATLLLAGAASALDFSLSPASATVSPGETLAFTLLSTDPAPSVVAGYDIDIVFNGDVASVSSYAVSNRLGDVSLGDAFDFSLGEATPGALNLTVLSVLDAPAIAPLQQGQFALASFSVLFGPTPPAGGTISFAISVNALSDADASPLAVTSLTGATVTVIPEPTSAVLLGGGLFGLASLRRSRASAIA